MVSKSELDSLMKVQTDAFRCNIQNVLAIFDRQVSKLSEDLKLANEEIATLKNQNLTLSKKISEIKPKLSSHSSTNAPQIANQSDLSERIDFLEDHSRRNNLKFFGIAEGETENWEQSTKKVLDLVREKLEITEPIEIERAHRVGKGLSRGPRPIVAKFLRFLNSTIPNCGQIPPWPR